MLEDSKALAERMQGTQARWLQQVYAQPRPPPRPSPTLSPQRQKARRAAWGKAMLDPYPRPAWKSMSLPLREWAGLIGNSRLFSQGHILKYNFII